MFEKFISNEENDKIVIKTFTIIGFSKNRSIGIITDFKKNQLL
jgi:hypothetical protein